MTFLGTFTRVVEFMRPASPGWSSGQPCVPLLALLPRRVSDDEARLLAGRIAGSATPFGATDIGVAIMGFTHEMPSRDDVARVERRLGETGPRQVQ